MQNALILETGLRTGEMIGLTWDAVDLKNRTLTVNKTMEYRISKAIGELVNRQKTVPMIPIYISFVMKPK